jgi:hypothetical protein
MTDKELAVRRCEIDVQLQARRVQDAQNALHFGMKKAQIEFDEKVANLTTELEKARLDLQREEAFLANAQAELERGFEA